MTEDYREQVEYIVELKDFGRAGNTHCYATIKRYDEQYHYFQGEGYFVLSEKDAAEINAFDDLTTYAAGDPCQRFPSRERLETETLELIHRVFGYEGPVTFRDRTSDVEDVVRSRGEPEPERPLVDGTEDDLVMCGACGKKMERWWFSAHAFSCSAIADGSTE